MVASTPAPNEGLGNGALTAVLLVLHVQVALAWQEQTAHDPAQGREVGGSVDLGRQVVTLLGLRRRKCGGRS